jgi:hypothetical protein
MQGSAPHVATLGYFGSSCIWFLRNRRPLFNPKHAFLKKHADIVPHYPKEDLKLSTSIFDYIIVIIKLYRNIQIFAAQVSPSIAVMMLLRIVVAWILLVVSVCSGCGWDDSYVHKFFFQESNKSRIRLSLISVRRRPWQLR